MLIEVMIMVTLSITIISCSFAMPFPPYSHDQKTKKPLQPQMIWGAHLSIWMREAILLKKVTKVLSIHENNSVELVTRCDNCVDRVCEAVRQKRRELSEAGIQLLLLLPPSLSDAPSLHHRPSRDIGDGPKACLQNKYRRNYPNSHPLSERVGWILY